MYYICRYIIIVCVHIIDSRDNSRHTQHKRSMLTVLANPTKLRRSHFRRDPFTHARAPAHTHTHTLTHTHSLTHKHTHTHRHKQTQTRKHARTTPPAPSHTHNTHTQHTHALPHEHERKGLKRAGPRHPLPSAAHCLLMLQLLGPKRATEQLLKQRQNRLQGPGAALKGLPERSRWIGWVAQGSLQVLSTLTSCVARRASARGPHLTAHARTHACLCV